LQTHPFLVAPTVTSAVHLPERIAYAREPSKLAIVLSADQVVRFLEAIPSLKSRTALLRSMPPDCACRKWFP
jgi:hypothetical protein